MPKTCDLIQQLLSSATLEFLQILVVWSQQGCWWGYRDPLIGWVSRVDQAVGETAHGFWHMEMENERYRKMMKGTFQAPKIPSLIIIFFWSEWPWAMFFFLQYTIFRDIHSSHVFFAGKAVKRSASFFSFPCGARWPWLGFRDSHRFLMTLVLKGREDFYGGLMGF